MTPTEQHVPATRWPLPFWLRRFLNHFIGQGLPRFNYLGDGNRMATVKHSGGQQVELVNAHYNPRLGYYVYWAKVGDNYVPIPEAYLEQEPEAHAE